ncbi:hypothetical protein SY83_17345 [Paenibacillus swuensis]|uniref:WYL domain-containing protein n=1 Tax=Paenibacillus swuensis TaxID=1178515 RepID=A0A172TLU4_9BACL|nr:hypothetical protein [Paenibacillus swuensis]ANE47753.1 hypothetical protein SY83_17345 [Paenibacillus swuensis]
MQIDKYIKTNAQIIYMDKMGRFTQRIIRIDSIEDRVVKVFCMDSKQPRTLLKDNILSFFPVGSVVH